MPDVPANDIASDALVVSIGVYPNSGGLLRPLPGATRDGARVRNWVHAHAPAMGIQEVVWPPLPGHEQEQPWNRYRLDGSMHDFICRGLQKMRGRLFVYISGHGRSTVQEPAMPAFYCAQHCRSLPDLFAPAGWIRLLTVAPIYREYLFFFDCCNEWQPGQIPVPPQIEVPYRADKPSVLVVAACMPNQQALETDRGGVFTDVLLEALSGSAGPQGANVTARDVVSYLKENVPIRAESLKHGHAQTPKEWFDSGLHADLETFNLFQRQKVSVEVAALVPAHVIEVDVLDADLEAIGTLAREPGGSMTLRDVFPGKYVLRACAIDWRQAVLVKTVIDERGNVAAIAVPMVVQ